MGHQVVVFNRDQKLGGLNEYGIAAYKTVGDFAQREVEYILAIGGIEVRQGIALGTDFTLAELRNEFDAVFLGFGLGAVNSLGIGDEDAEGVSNAVDYIAELRQADNKGDLPVGERIVVIGGGMTAIDIAVQSKRLGAANVDLVYRRGPEQMGASDYEQAFAQTSGVTIRHWARPQRIIVEDRVTAVEFESTRLSKSKQLEGTGETFLLEADVVFKAVGQALSPDVLDEIDESPGLLNGKILVGENRETSLAGVWAGGDCVFDNDDLTVTAVQDGKVAAIAIDKFLREEGKNG